MAEQEKAIVQTFTSYVDAFQTLNPQAASVLPRAVRFYRPSGSPRYGKH